jgi:hypothetical protein
MLILREYSSVEVRFEDVVKTAVVNQALVEAQGVYILEDLS